MSTANGHVQEPTVMSLNETLVDHGEDAIRPSIETRFEGAFEIPNDSDPKTEEPEENPTGLHRDGTLDRQIIPAVIPPDHAHRTLVLCFDGTGDQFDSDNSNIIQLFSLLKKNDRTKQMVYYQSGIGTYTSPKVATPLMSKLSKTLDAMVAWDLDAHVMDGYEFLMQNYLAGDKICIFGFSRGAYTARSLAGMLHKVGLLPADNFQQVPFAYKMYTRADDVGWEQSNEFKKAFSIDVKIEFLGVWDTVDSVGLIPKRLPFTTSNTIVRTFRHALALDEHRAKFKANLWNRPSAKEEKLGTHCTPANAPWLSAPKTSTSTAVGPDPKKRKQSSGVKESQEEKDLSTLERMYSEKGDKQTDVEEVWFAGCHCDVGGGSVSNKTRHALARIPLRWMIRECFKTNSGIMFDTEALRTVGLDPSTLYPHVTPRPPPLPVSSMEIQSKPAVPIPLRPQARLKKQHLIPELNPALHKTAAVPFLGSEEEEELRDALSPKYDQLKIKKYWWILEILPLELRYQAGNNEWVKYFAWNLGRPRFIPKQSKNGIKIHRSVKLRMEAQFADPCAKARGKKYKPKPNIHVEPIWID